MTGGGKPTYGRVTGDSGKESTTIDDARVAVLRAGPVRVGGGRLKPHTLSPDEMRAGGMVGNTGGGKRTGEAAERLSRDLTTGKGRKA